MGDGNFLSSPRGWMTPVGPDDELETTSLSLSLRPPLGTAYANVKKAARDGGSGVKCFATTRDQPVASLSRWPVARCSR